MPHLSKIQRNMQKIGRVALSRKYALRRRATSAEKEFMKVLLRYAIPFHFQKLVFTGYRYFILDFIVQMKPRTIIEIDGESHLGKEKEDKERESLVLKTKTYRKFGFARITNQEILSGKSEKFIRNLWRKRARLFDEGRIRPAKVPKKYRYFFQEEVSNLKNSIRELSALYKNET